MKTQAQHTTLIRDMLDEATTRQWTQAQIYAWINEAARDIAKSTECLRGTENVTVVAGTQTYTLTSGIVRLHRVEYRKTGQTQVYPLEYRDFMNMDDVWWTGQESTPGDPMFWTTWGVAPALTLTLYPTPTVAGTLKLFKYRTPTDLATDGSATASNVEVPEGWEDLVLEYACMQAKRKDRDSSWQEHKVIYDEKMHKLNDIAVRYTDQAGAISTWNGFGAVPRWLWDEDY